MEALKGEKKNGNNNSTYNKTAILNSVTISYN